MPHHTQTKIDEALLRVHRSSLGPRWISLEGALLLLSLLSPFLQQPHLQRQDVKWTDMIVRFIGLESFPQVEFEKRHDVQPLILQLMSLFLPAQWSIDRIIV